MFVDSQSVYDWRLRRRVNSIIVATPEASSTNVDGSGTLELGTGLGFGVGVREPRALPNTMLVPFAAPTAAMPNALNVNVIALPLSEFDTVADENSEPEPRSLNTLTPPVPPVRLLTEPVKS